jgi:diguanylate cyclase (GGDEF)-like protein
MPIGGEGVDSLTGLPSKDAFDKVLQAALESSDAVGQLSLAFCDIDKFIEANKRGRENGDMVLQSIAKEIKSWLPGDQMQVFRLGGDEFAVVMPGTEKEEAFLTLEQLRLRIQGLDKLGQLQPAPTVSIGIASYPDDAGTRQELIRKADDALYRAKTTGRNKVGLAREEKKVPKTSHYTQGQLERLSTLSSREGVGEAELLREALDDLLKKYAS